MSYLTINRINDTQCPADVLLKIANSLHRNPNAMKWEDIRQKYPSRWLLVEATAAHSEDQFRVLDELEVIEVFEDSATALRRYKEEHHTNPLKELFVLHTSRKELLIEERRWVGIRA